MTRLNRHWVSLVYPVLLVAMAYVYGVNEHLYHQVLLYWGASAQGIPFSDLHANLTQIACAENGLNPYLVHPGHPECKGFNYSPALLSLGFMVPKPADHHVFGVLNIFLFSLLIQFLPFRNKSTDHAYMTIALLSGPVIWILETCNLDVVLFQVTFLLSYLLSHDGGRRLAGYGLILGAALMKFYPLVLGLHIIRERLPVAIRILAVYLAIILAFIAYYHSDLLIAVQTLPRGSYFKYCWGSVVFPLGFYYLATGIDLLEPGLSGPMSYVAYGALGLLILLLLGRAIAFSNNRNFAESVQALNGLPRMLLLSGCLVMVGCFFAWENLAFRQVYFLLIIPAFLLMKRMEWSGDYPLMRHCLVMILALMWWDAFSIALKNGLDAIGLPAQVAVLIEVGFWVARQLCWWHIISVFCGILIVFVRSSRTMHDLQAFSPRLFSWVGAR